MNLRDNDMFASKNKSVADLLRQQEEIEKLFQPEQPQEQQRKDDVDEGVLNFMAALGLDVNGSPKQAKRTNEDIDSKNGKVPSRNGDGKTLDELFQANSQGSLTVEGVAESLRKVAPSANPSILKKMAEQVIKDHR